ncbi:MAG: hypothetical protein SOR40_06960 [Rothia sp. (in: high G+C Gram-positive bacteria)]|nr:hypothetical protein [Rothia sp. (in: high G+C Gram-positive bacteria)]
MKRSFVKLAAHVAEIGKIKFPYLMKLIKVKELKLSKTAICALATSLLAACTSMGSQPQAESSASSSSLPQVDRSAYRGVQATLDPATGSVETPLDRYVYQGLSVKAPPMRAGMKHHITH